jgi:hypothetical protein
MFDRVKIGAARDGRADAPPYISSIIVANSQKEKQFNKIAINSGDMAFLLCARQQDNKAKRLEIKRNFVYNKTTWCLKNTA